LTSTRSHLAKAHLISHEHRNLQTRLYEESKKKTTSCRRIHKGGAVKVSVVREKKRKRDEFEKSEAIRLARKRIQTYKNKAWRALKTRGAAARREEKARKATVAQLLANGDLVPFHLLDPIREPDKNPTEEERESLIPHLSLIQALNELLPSGEDIPIDPNLEENEPEIRLVPMEEEDPIGRVDEEVETEDDEHIDLDDLDEDSSDEESLVSNDSITRNADFIALY